jgi:hypothetical protein
MACLTELSMNNVVYKDRYIIQFFFFCKLRIVFTYQPAAKANAAAQELLPFPGDSAEIWHSLFCHIALLCHFAPAVSRGAVLAGLPALPYYWIYSKDGQACAGQDF